MTNGGFTVGGRMLYPGIVIIMDRPKYDSRRIERALIEAASGKERGSFNIAASRNMEHYTDMAR